MPIYSVREKYEYYKQNLRKYSTNPFRVEENKTKQKIYLEIVNLDPLYSLKINL